MTARAELTPLPERPLVSIVVPSFNQGAFIRQTIASCLEQDYRPIEIVVMDGGSTDGTVAVLESFGAAPELRWVSEPDGGVQDAVNRGVGLAKGDLCAIQSSDDFYLPGVLSAAVEAFRRHPDAALIYADTVKVDAGGRELSRFVTGPYAFTHFLCKRTVILQPAAFFRREAFLAVGGWSRDFFNADTECWLRMLLRYRAVKIDAFWAGRRMHPGQRDEQRARIIRDHERMTRSHPRIRTGPRRWRLAARCGNIRHALRYGGIVEPRARRKALWKAALLWPPVLLDAEVAGLLLPFYHAIRRRCRGCRERP